MSRSRKKTPICGNIRARSEKQDKKQWHKTLRSKARQILHTDYDTEILPEDKDVSDPWSMNKDGKKMFDPETWPKRMRK
jgi:hypothetical protein